MMHLKNIIFGEKEHKLVEKDLLMKKGTWVALIALTVAAVGVIIALAAYFKNKTRYLYDDDDFLFDNPDDLDLYSVDDLSNHDFEVAEPAAEMNS